MIGECYIGDVREGLRAMLAAGVRAQTCVTSPPYWGLRDYGHAGQIGLEPTIAEYVANMVEVFRLVRDVLEDDGTLWLNLGDSYAGSGRGGNPNGSSTLEGGQSSQDAAMVKRSRDDVSDHQRDHSWSQRGGTPPPIGLKTKDLCGIPWRVAFALQADGWYLRQDIIWAKPNPMPESVTDRCTKSHEYLFLLSKSERYFYDAAAIAEPATESTIERISQPGLADQAGSFRAHGGMKHNGPMKAMSGPTRNRRSVWTVTTQPFSDAHFATFPPKLIEPCILAGSRPGDVVLDPFMGSGTTAMVAQSLGRRWAGCELNPDYVAMQKLRAAQTGLELA